VKALNHVGLLGEGPLPAASTGCLSNGGTTLAPSRVSLI
jgi:hypothetical protein